MTTRYRLGAPIALSETIEVYEAVATTEQGIEWPVVYRRLNPELVTDAELVREFTVEAEALSRLHHGGIVRLIDFGIDAVTGPYQVLERVEGETLAALAARVPADRFPPEVALFIAREAAHALDHAHRIGRVVHRDVTPSNLLLSWSAEVKVVDFGIARLLDQRRETRVGLVKGTPSYAAPEQIRGDDVDARADVFSLGCVLHRLVASTSPQSSDTSGVSLDSALAPDLRAIIERATRSDRALRYRSAAALAAECGEALAKRTSRDPRTLVLEWLGRVRAGETEESGTFGAAPVFTDETTTGSTDRGFDDEVSADTPRVLGPPDATAPLATRPSVPPSGARSAPMSETSAAPVPGPVSVPPPSVSGGSGERAIEVRALKPMSMAALVVIALVLGMGAGFEISRRMYLRSPAATLALPTIAAPAPAAAPRGETTRVAAVARSSSEALAATSAATPVAPGPESAGPRPRPHRTEPPRRAVGSASALTERNHLLARAGLKWSDVEANAPELAERISVALERGDPAVFPELERWASAFRQSPAYVRQRLARTAAELARVGSQAALDLGKLGELEDAYLRLRRGWSERLTPAECATFVQKLDAIDAVLSRARP